MKILVMGAGVVGKAVAHDLSRDYDISVGDKDEKNLEKVEGQAETFLLDIEDEEEVISHMKEHDVVVGSLPGRFGLKTIKLALEAGVDIVDVSFMPEDPLPLDDKAKQSGSTVIVDAGFGPGMSNVFAGKIAENIDELERLKIWIGSLPIKAEPPLFYKLTWSPKDLIEEYTRPARYIIDGEVVEVDPMEDIKKDMIIDDKEFEGFYSDGLRTLLETIEVKDMEEITLRWAGHLEKFRILRELGFFDEENVDFTLDVIKDKMDYESDDFSIMKVVGEGPEEDVEVRETYLFYDEESEGFSSIARSTGFSTAVMTRSLIEKDLRDGVIPPEELGRKEDLFDFLIEGLKDRGIHIERNISSL